MKKLLTISFLFLFNHVCFAQSELEYEFDKARAMLAKREIIEAINSLNIIYKSNPKGGNINFLLGAAFAEIPGESKKAIYHLKKSLPLVSEKYVVGSFQEKNAPIHAYYYLTLSLVQQDRCAEAAKMLIELKKYSKKIDPYFILEAEKNMIKCPYEVNEVESSWEENEAIPEGYDPFEVEEEPKLDTLSLAERGMLILPLEYTTNSPIYAVQIGSNINPSPTSSFSRVKNVDALVDNEGIIRYVVGHFSYRSQAETLQISLVEKGYEDAFVVDVNNERKYGNELISYQNINIKAGIKGTVEYYVQLGAFEKNIPDSIINLYHEIDKLEEVKYETMTLLMVGKFSTYSEAMKKKEELMGSGYANCFVVAFNRKTKIPLQEAINYTD